MICVLCMRTCTTANVVSCLGHPHVYERHTPGTSNSWRRHIRADLGAQLPKSNVFLNHSGSACVRVVVEPLSLWQVSVCVGTGR